MVACMVTCSATASAKSVEMVAPSCPSSLAAEVASILEVELPTNAGATTTAGRWRVTLTCSPNGESVALTVEQAASAAHSETVVALGDVLVNARPRVIALELAEMIRDVASPTRGRAAQPVESAPAAQPSAAPQPMVTRPSRRSHVTRDLALGLATIACAALVTGVVLTARDNDHGERKGPDGDEAASGVSFSVGALTFLGSSVNFALWWRDRARPVHEDPSVATQGPALTAKPF